MPLPLAFRVLAACFAALTVLRAVNAQDYALSVLTSPSGCLGGEACVKQPIVAVVQRSNGEIAYTFEGSIYAQLGSSPTGYEKLYYGSLCDFYSCGVEVSGTVASIGIVNGIATFKNLLFRKAGKGYTLRFLGKTVGGKDFATTTSGSFEVTAGSAYKLLFFNHTGNAFGGTPLADNPTVGMVDRGENVVPAAPTAIATVSLATSPHGTEMLRPVSQLSVPFVNGLATFKGLYINESGFPYQLKFECPQCGVPSILSNQFHVAVGEVAKLVVVSETEPASQVVRAGEFLARPPAVKLLDAGGNHVDRDNSSAVLLEIFNNPQHAAIGPAQARLLVTAKQGVVRFRQIFVDRQGQGYTLRFTWFAFSTATARLNITGVSVLSKPFPVLLGPTRRLVLRRSAADAWAGQQPFGGQPSLWLTDFGGNLVTTDFTSAVTMRMMESLSVGKQIVIDTKDAPQSQFSSVIANVVTDGVFGAGEVLVITFISPFHLTVHPSVGGISPSLTLAITDGLGAFVSATLTGITKQTRRLSFMYTVAAGDSLAPATPLLAANALVLNGARIEDGNLNQTATTIPANGIQFEVHTAAPAIVDLSCDTVSGEYGAGYTIRFNVSFDQPVVVVGQPYLALATTNAVTGSVISIAPFSGMSEDGLTVQFDYEVAEGESTAGNLALAVPSILYPNLTVNSTFVDVINVTVNGSVKGYAYPHRFNTTGQVWIRRLATIPTTNIDPSFPSGVLTAFDTAWQLVIDTQAPKLDPVFGVQCLNTSGVVYAPGDHLHLLIRFDKPIEWRGVSLRLRVDAGPSVTHGSAYVRALLADEQTMEFVYVVRPGDSTSRMDIISTWNALQLVSNDSYVTRKGSTTIADFDISAVYNGGYSLRDTASIALNGSPLTVLAATVQAPDPNVPATLLPDDVLTLQVGFSGSVVATCTPVLVLAMNYYREAVFLAGNGTDTFTFQYTVRIGDAASSVSLRAAPSALCATARCPLRTSCALLAAATEPTLPIDLRIPSGASATVLLANHVFVPTKPLRLTSVTSIEVLNPAGEYGAGSVIQLKVTFTDIVVVTGVDKPRLYLNINAYADYAGGNYGPALLFRYITTESDSLLLTSLAPALVGSTSSALVCLPTRCNITNQAFQEADLATDLSLVVASPSGVTLDPTPPTVTSVSFLSPQSVYTAGELIQLAVYVSKPVIVGGLLPRVQLKLAPYNPSAIYSPSLSSAVRLVFTYRSRVGEDASSVSYLSTEIDMVLGYAIILRASDIPVTAMDVRLPLASSSAAALQSLHVDAVTVPTVVNVSFVSLPGTYRAGDTIEVLVTFSQEVVAMGKSRLALTMGARVGYASYFAYYPSVGGPGRVSADYGTVSAPTRRLLYQYIVSDGDRSDMLDYVDEASLELLVTTNQDPTYIRRVDDAVSIDAALMLPLPGSRASLSASAAINVDGVAAYAFGLHLVNPAGMYSVGDVIKIAMNFSKPVSVRLGVPSIVLETGELKNEAFYASGSGTSVLLFEYTPEPGDSTTQLDYVHSRRQMGQAAGAFRYNGAEILTTSLDPIQPAHIHFNPTRGKLKGRTAFVADEGVVVYDDVYITQMGPDYELMFEAQVAGSADVLMTSQHLHVSHSAEFELRPAAARAEELIGHSVAIQNDLAIVGAPGFNLSVTTIQVVNVTLARGLPQREVQAVQTFVNLQPAVQTFHTSGSVGADLEGYFTLSFGSYGPSQPIPANADPYTLAAIISYDLPVLGNVEITRSAYLYCACNNAFTWTITFLDYGAGVMDKISVDSFLTGRGAEVSAISVLQAPALLSGTFTLSALGKTSPAIPMDANLTQMALAVQTLGLFVYDVTVSPSSPSQTRTWSVTFDAYRDSYEVPLLVADSRSLTGGPQPGVTVITMQPGRHGPRGIAGYFQLEFRGNISSQLPPNATADQVRIALEALPSINTVEVSRTLINKEVVAYSWTIDFLSVNSHSLRGDYEDPKFSNVEPLVAHNHLIASDVSINVDAAYALGSRARISSSARAGTYGAGAGAVFVYQRNNDTWQEIVTVRGHDTTEANRFGSSVALDGDVLLVGAVGGNHNGKPEVQSLRCQADSGRFYVKFRGWTSNLISSNATKAELLDVLATPSSTFDNLHSITAITIIDWPGDSVCDNHTIAITFYSPVDGAPQLYGQSVDTTHADIELLELVSFDLTNADLSAPVLEANEVQKGTWRVHGADSDEQQIGSAYVFRMVTVCPLNTSMFCAKEDWLEETVLFPPAVYRDSEYGSSVALQDNVALVAAPGTNNNVGAVYVYEYDAAALAWKHLQTLVDPEQTADGRFGNTIAMHGNTIVVSSVQRYTDVGQIIVFIRPTSTGGYVAFQFLKEPVAGPGTRYGEGLAVHGDVMAIGASKADGTSLYLGSVQQRRTHSGKVYIFERSGPLAAFELTQTLLPANVNEFDRFGTAIVLADDVTVVSAVEAHWGEILSSKTVYTLSVDADFNCATPLGGMFRVTYQTTNASLSASGPAYATRWIAQNVRALKLQEIIAADLYIGEVSVSRSAPSSYGSGFQWTITFLSPPGDPWVLNGLDVDGSRLTGCHARASMIMTNATPPALRHSTHFFERTKGTHLLGEVGGFVEQLYLNPYSHQHVDRCGVSLGISDTNVIVGCPWRDQRVPGRNSGAAFVFDISLLAMKAVQPNAEAVEGDLVQATVHRDTLSPLTPTHDLAYTLMTLDRNAPHALQEHVAHIYGLHNDSLLPGVAVFMDRTGLVGKAVARCQHYGSPDDCMHRWVDGRYDYRAVADYAPTSIDAITLAEENDTSINVPTLPDTIVEMPEETFTVVAWSPGLWPSIFGKLVSHVRLRDISTGEVDGEQRFAKLSPSAPAPTPHPITVDTETARTQGGFGSVVATSEECDIIFVASRLFDPRGNLLIGEVRQFQRSSNGSHRFVGTIDYPGAGDGGLGFGESLAVHCSEKRHTATLVVGQPSSNRAFVYTASIGSVPGYKNQVIDFQLVGNVSVVEARTSIDRFAAALAVSADFFAVGCPGQEAVYLYEHTFGVAWSWDLSADPQRLRSSDYDYDVITGRVFVHRQHFGHSVALQGRTLVVGAPRGDYQNLAESYLANSYDTEGESIETLARGAVYIYGSTPPVQQVCLSADQVLSNGGMVLTYSHWGTQTATGLLSFNASAETVRAALEGLPNCESVVVTRSERYHNDSSTAATAREYCWTVTFLHAWANDAGVVTASVLNHPFNFTADPAVPLALGRSVSVEALQTVGAWTEMQSLRAPDGQPGDHFGWAVALDAGQLVVGAPKSSALCGTTWDFETGDLRGWTATLGDAFIHQPTLGDNLKYRPVYSSSNALRDVGMYQFHSQGVGLRGEYFLSTLDLHPDMERYPYGSTQGVEPTGILTSDTFMILGDRINFLVAGGCDLDHVYVELRVDGYAVQRISGGCTDVMRPAAFDTRAFRNRAAQIWIVDNSSTAWGFLAVDDFSFDWPIDGALTYRDGHSYSSFYTDKPRDAAVPGGTPASAPPMLGHAGRTETVLAGAAYVFVRTDTDYFPCRAAQQETCWWELETRLLASDKRSQAQFGTTVGVLATAGLVVVGAPGAPLQLSYKDTPTAYPYSRSLREDSDASGLVFPAQPADSSLFQALPSYRDLASGSAGVWALMTREGIDPPETVRSGALYVFAKQKDVLGHTGQQAREARWLPTEHARLQPPDLSGGDAFGSALQCSSMALHCVAGAPSTTPLSTDQGAAYQYKLEFAAMRFEKAVFVVREGAQAVATVTLVRDLSVSSGRLVLEFATSDLTARGVDAAHFQRCKGMPVGERAASQCGDYAQTAGHMVLEPGVTTGGFTVAIMDDYCFEPRPKFVQLTLSVPGAGALQGEAFHAMIRIDDDDFTSSERCLAY